jgi:hypothetical protein
MYAAGGVGAIATAGAVGAAGVDDITAGASFAAITRAIACAELIFFSWNFSSSISRPLPKKARKKLPAIFFMVFSRPLIRGGYRGRGIDMDALQQQLFTFSLRYRHDGVCERLNIYVVWVYRSCCCSM